MIFQTLVIELDYAPRPSEQSAVASPCHAHRLANSLETAKSAVWSAPRLNGCKPRRRATIIAALGDSGRAPDACTDVLPRFVRPPLVAVERLVGAPP